MRPETIHLTLAFLGEIATARLPGAIAAARRVCVPGHGFVLGQTRYWKHNRLIWAGPREAPDALVNLANALAGELGQAGFELDKRRFAAHVTLVRKAREPGQLPPLPVLEWPVDEFVLVRSAFTGGRTAYDVLERFVLLPSGPGDQETGPRGIA